MKRMALLSAVAVSVFTPAFAADLTPEDKSQYTLFNPTPVDLMRPWRTDRAGATPYTIDAGHFEVDVTAVSYANVEREEIVLPFVPFKQRTDVWRYGVTSIKLGLLNRLDAEVTIVPYET